MPSPENKTPSRRRRWLKRLAVFAAFAVLLLCTALWTLTKNLTDIARWAVQRSLPAAKAEIADVRYESHGRLVVKTFVLRDRISGIELFRLERGSVVFSFNDLRRRELGEIRLVHPRIRISPELFKILPSGGGGGSALPWSARRIVCDYAEISCVGFGPTSPDVDMKCAFDWNESASDNKAPLRLTAWDIHASTPGVSRPFLTLDLVNLSATVDDLIHHRLGEIELVHPGLKVTPDLFQTLPAGRGETSPSLPWTARKISCDYAEISCEGFGPAAPVVNLKCAFDWNEPGADPQAPLRLTSWDVQVSAPASPKPFLTLDLVNLDATLQGLLEQHEIAGVELAGGRLLLGSALQQVLSSPSSGSPTASPVATWKIGQLDIKGVSVRLEDTRETAADISFQIDTSLKNLSLSQAAGAIGDEEKTVELADIEILSPYDPFTKVLTMRRVFLKFTLGGLLHSELAGVTILNPSIYVGPDLFWYMDDAQSRLGEEKSPSTGPAWKIGTLKVESGRLLVGSGGHAKYGLPLNFNATAENIALDNLAALKLQTAFEIPAQTYPFPSYQLEVSTQKGDLQFAYPPEKNENNLVGKVFFNTIRWRQYEATNAWLSATFDHSGINGDFGGRVYGGYLKGGFSFLFEDEAPWVGWLYGEKVDLKRLTDIISPQNFQMNGPLDFKIQMDAFGSRIARLKGYFHARKPGRMKIGKLDDFLANIPETWNSLKKSSTRIALEALRDFDYTKAGGDFWFVDNQGILGLKLQGPLGSRNFEVVLHADESLEGRWKQKP